jgi:hypothetical protein
MKTHYLLRCWRLLILLFFPILTWGQAPFAFPQFGSKVVGVSAFLSARWGLKDSVSGDLNGDGRPDMAVVLEYADTVTELRPDSIENTGKPRILLVLLRDSVGNGYRVAVQNNTFLLRDGEGGMAGDPYAGIGISDGVLEVYFQFLRESLSYKFRYRGRAFCLIGAFDAGGDPHSFESWDYNFSTKKAKHEWSHEDEDHVEWRRFTLKAPVLLQEMKKPYMLNVFEDGDI